MITGRTRAVQAAASGETRLFGIDRTDIAAMARHTAEVWRFVATLSVLNELVAIGAGDDLMIATRESGWSPFFCGCPGAATPSSARRRS